ncbi:Pkinase-domain-containing protein [Stereum hirsutum FP-91666 SS1]|uniref:Pkinase-domain-containing protein n=1 Tax=Stereum hirsutum (strain FP-91666) TaxID=721885 RepID=UPI00044499CD|nr:Pkinase-domain-containing protein [Stereum hirsutum FP-91666 SS1]EIM81190.1 Pkinase-domain-containing protein [Stereum hirsutum FP-91666 SS1]
MQVDVDESFAVPLNSRTIRPNQTHRQTDALSPNRLSRAYSVQDLRRAGVFSSSNPGQEALERYPHSDWSDDVLEVIDRLGEGVGGAVHSVRHTRTGTTMARKTITTREAPIKQLVRELTMITTISHPNIVHFYGAYMSPSSSEVKVLMELCEGGSLQTVVERIKRRKGRVGEKVAGRLAEGVLQGLAYLHSKRLIHRDIKPSNILLSRQGIIKLCDFGVSGELVKSHADTYTGTCYYMAPERITGNEYSIRADIWSTGLSILELAQNRFPYPQDLPFIDIMIHISQSEPPQLEDDPDTKWSDPMKDFIRLCLTVDPSQRPTPKDMLHHPWIVKMIKTKVDMAQWICDVWGWDSPEHPRCPLKEK